MGNAHLPMKDTDSEDSSDEEFAYDTLARDITYKRCSSKTDSLKTPARSISVKRSDSGRSRNKVTRSVSSRRKPSFKASTRRSPSKSSLYKARRDNKLYLSDMEIQVEDGKVAKLVARESVLEKKGMTPVKAKLKSWRKESITKKQHLHLTLTQQEAIKIGPMKLRPPPKLGLTRKASYGAAISNSNDVNDIISAIAKESDAKTKKKQLQSTESYNIANSTNDRLTQDSKKSSKSRSKSMYTNVNNNSSTINIAEIEAQIGKLSVTTSITDV